MGSVLPDYSYVIVGAGFFGASTALQLITKHPTCKVTLLDNGPFPNPSAASHDLNKIIRANYPDLAYMRLALEAEEQWRTEELYSKFYHETGMLFAEDFGMGRDVLRNFKIILGNECPASMLEPAIARQKFDGIFADAEWAGVKQNFYNPKSGWGEADKALDAVIRAAIDRGVEYNSEGASKLIFDHDLHCTGIMTSAGNILESSRIILCTGAATALLLADSAPTIKSLQVDGRQVAAAAITCCVRVPETRRQRFQNVPVMFNGLNHTHGEMIPLTPEGYLKFTFELSFTNKKLHEASGQTFSVIPSRKSQTTWGHDVPEQCKREVQTVVQNIYGKEMDGLNIENYRMCWDAVTPNQDWIIAPHPASHNLYIASGGSFHAWKFLPNLGKYVVQMLDKELSKELMDKWAWDRKDEGAACEMYVPTRDLKDFDP